MQTAGIVGECQRLVSRAIAISVPLKNRIRPDDFVAQFAYDAVESIAADECGHFANVIGNLVEIKNVTGLEIGNRIAIHRAGRCKEYVSVVARAARKDINPKRHLDDVVAVARVDRVVALTSINIVVAGPAVDRIVVVSGVYDVVAVAGINRVVPVPSVYYIIAGRAGNHIVRRVAKEFLTYHWNGCQRVLSERLLQARPGRTLIFVLAPSITSFLSFPSFYLGKHYRSN